MIRLNFSVRNGKRWKYLCCHHLNIFFPATLRGVGLRKEPRPGSGGDFAKHPSQRRLAGLLFFFSRNVRAISTARLNMSPCLHLRPIGVVVCGLTHVTRSLSWAGFVLRCFQHLSYPDSCYCGSALGGTTGAQEVCPARCSRTSAGSPQISTPTTDRDRTVSRRSEPSSRATLIGEQPNPWGLLQPTGM